MDWIGYRNEYNVYITVETYSEIQCSIIWATISYTYRHDYRRPESRSLSMNECNIYIFCELLRIQELEVIVPRAKCFTVCYV